MNKLSVFDLLNVPCKFECNLSVEHDNSIKLNFLFLHLNKLRILKLPIFMKSSSSLPKLKTLMLLKRNEVKIKKSEQLTVPYIELDTVQKISDFIDVVSIVYSSPISFQIIHFNELITIFEKKDFLKLVKENFNE